MSSVGVQAASRCDLGGGVVVEPDAVLEEPQHQVLPAASVDGIVGARTDARFGVGDVVEEPVVGDAGGGVVPHRCGGGCRWALAEPGGEPCGWVGLEAVGGVVGGGVDGSPVQVGVAGRDAVAGERRGPLLFGVLDGERTAGERVGGGGCEVDGVGMVDDDEVGPVERPDGGPPLDALEVDGAGAGGVVDGEDVADVVAIDGPHSTADVEVGAGRDRCVELGALLGRVVDPAVAFGVGGVAGPAQQLGRRRWWRRVRRRVVRRGRRR